MFKEDNISERDLKETLLKMYTDVVWVSVAIEVIAKRLVSGGLAIEEVEQGKGNDANRKALLDFFGLINEHWDFKQFFYSVAVDLLVFGESYIEIVRGAGNKPQKLYKVDCLTMKTIVDRHGGITGFEQTLPNTIDPIPFEPEQIIRMWFPHPRSNMKALSPLQRVIQNCYNYSVMLDLQQSVFRQGANHPYQIDFPTEDFNEAERQKTAYIQENTGKKNFGKPAITYGGTNIKPFNSGSIDAIYQKGMDMQRDAILAGFGVPPAMADIIETGNIGGGTGESQEESLLRNTVDPIRNMIFEKINYRIVKDEKLGLGIDDLTVSTRYGDYRDKDSVAKIQDMRIRNGTLTVNEARAEAGKEPVKGGDVSIFASGREVIALETFTGLVQKDAMSVQQQQLQLKQQELTVSQQAQATQQPPQTNVPSGKQDASTQAGSTFASGAAQPNAKEDDEDGSDQWTDGSLRAVILENVA